MKTLGIIKKVDLVQENKRLKDALKQAAETINEAACPFDWHADFCDEDIPCDGIEKGVQCWIDHWMGKGGK